MTDTNTPTPRTDALRQELASIPRSSTYVLSQNPMELALKRYEELERELAALRAELERVTTELREVYVRLEACQNALSDSDQRAAAVEADAKRYRWLRQQYEDKPYAVFAWDDDCAISNEELDAAIDAALKGELR